MFKKIVPVFAVLGMLFIAPTPSWAACDGMSGKDLKKCEKSAAKMAKLDASTTPFVPSALDSSLSAWDGDNNPFATDAYRSRVAQPLEIASVDAFSASVAEMHATVVFARYLIDEAGKGNSDAIKAVPALVKMLSALPDKGKALVADGQALPSKLTSELTGKDAMKIPKASATVAGLISTVTGTITEIPEVAKALASFDPAAAAGAAAGAAIEEGMEKVEGVMPGGE